MFTGIVLHTGTVRNSRRGEDGVLELEIEAPGLVRDLDRGDSVAVNGVCLTAVEVRRRRFRVQVIEETLARTTLSQLARGARVNLELAARLSDRLGGHLVQGHVDGVAEAVRVERSNDAIRVWWAAGDDLLRYVVPKGSVALDGVSLTVVDVGRTTFEVALIPHTVRATTFDGIQPGRRANLEPDVIAKYVERLTRWGDRRAG
ncbi:MAG TPA: riboflavin synthase [Actinomycetota bacterium]|nr:riboflavin synthase [Actinomycetota bacterium]